MKDAVLKAALLSRVYEAAQETPLEFAPQLSNRTGNRVWLKREDLQQIFSFKIRGAYNKMASLGPAILSRGVVASSAGNHAQGVAWSAQKLGCRAVIVMPQTTPDIKVDAVRTLGSEVVLHGDGYDDAYAMACELGSAQGLTFIHPYDDAEVIAGQATIGIEILRQLTEPIQGVYIPVGGGGLIAGVGAVIKELRPEIRVIGVEAEDSDAMRQSLAAGQPITLEKVGRFADGAAVRTVGSLAFSIAKEVVDEMVTVTNDEICAAIKDAFEDRRCILEPAGALAFAGLKKHAAESKLTGKNLIAIASGANTNFESLRHISERAEIGEFREAILAVTIPERPGSFLEFCQRVGNRSITEFNYRFADAECAHVFVGVKIRDRKEIEELASELSGDGYAVFNLSEDEIAKLHIRHMVGGRAKVSQERIFHFTFPERSGALLRFLEAMGGKWNISLFHYRNHGSDYGRVLVGIQIPPEESDAFDQFVQSLGYEFSEETDNEACSLFLG
jgi:threonine dehydratase